jgi:hypothetical protein
MENAAEGMPVPWLPALQLGISLGYSHTEVAGGQLSTGQEIH